MVDYSPKFTGQDATLTAGAAITGGQLLYVSGTNTVSPTAGSTAAWSGVARQDAAVGERVVRTRGGVQKIKASGTIAAGDRLIPANLGRVATLGAGNADHSVGTALTGGPDATVVLVEMDR